MEERVTFPAGGLQLEGLLSLPSRASGIGVVVCHPHPLRGGEMGNNVVSGLVRGFREAGAATLRFNFRGVGASEGTHDDGRGEVEDVNGAVTCLLGRGTFSTVVVSGYSFGSVVGLRAGATDDRVHILIGVALPLVSRDVSFLAGVRKPKLLISGDRDDYSPAPKLQALMGKVPEPKALTIVPGADHFFGGLEDRVADAAVAFVTAQRG